MAEHEGQKGSARRPLDKALWMKTLDQLEAELSAHQQRSSSPVPAASALHKIAQRPTTHPEQLVLKLGALTQEHGGFDPSNWGMTQDG